MVLLIRVEVLEKYDAGSNVFDQKRRLERLSGQPCLVLSHTQIALESVRSLKPRAIVMSGFGTSFSEFDTKAFWPLDDLVKHTDTPLLAICGSHQLLAHLFNHDIRRVAHLSDEPMRNLLPGECDLGGDGFFREQGFYPVDIVKSDPLFDGLANPFLVRQSHYCEVKTLPDDFELLASTQACRIQAMKHKTKLMYGTQFHPEAYVERYPDGRTILCNFFRIAGIAQAPSS